jgi:tetratricopeptide (TPR) repeat protein
MTRLVLVAAVAAALTLPLAAPPAALGQLTTAGIRGRVIDEKGEPVPDVAIEMEFKGETRTKVVRSQKSDKNGGFVRMGIPDGKWQISFTREGYKPYVMEIHLSLGGFSEAGDVVMEAAPVVVATVPDAEIEAPPDELERVGALYAAAVEAARAGRYDDAEAELKELLASHPDVGSAHYNLGYVYRMKQDWKAAEAEYLRVTELEPHRTDAFISLAAVRELDGRSVEAAEGLLAAAPAFPDDARLQYAVGITAVNAGRSAEAEAAFRRVLELDPANAEARYQLGTILVGQAKTDEAVAMLEAYVGMTGQDPANLQTATALIAALKKKR